MLNQSLQVLPIQVIRLRSMRPDLGLLLARFVLRTIPLDLSVASTRIQFQILVPQAWTGR